MLHEKLKPGIYRLVKTLRPVLPYGVLANLAQWLTRYAHEKDYVQDRLAESGFDASNKSAYPLVPVQHESRREAQSFLFTPGQ